MDQLFPGIPKILFEGPTSGNPLVFKRYDPARRVGNATMAEILRFSIAYWHSFCAKGIDPFGDATMQRPWNHIADPMEAARMRMRGAFELTEKLSIPFFCFHDRDIAPEAETLRQTNRHLDEIVALAKELMKTSPTRLLWGTANLFSHPRYVHGAATSPHSEVYAYAAAQVKKALEITRELGGANYVFWGGREGYETLLNTDMKLERENLGRFLHMAVEYADEIGFEGQFLIEPKPKEPTKHQYDSDAAACHAFLLEFGLVDRFKLNIETNHATLAGHTMQHELRYARDHGILGSVDANQGDELLGWDTDQFPTNLYTTTLIMYEILAQGGIGQGGLNFDAKPRRGSFEVEDLVASHIAGMDSFAHGLLAAHGLLESGALEKSLIERYASWRQALGDDIRLGKETLKSLEAKMLDAPAIKLKSGKQEILEAVLNQYIIEAGRL